MSMDLEEFEKNDGKPFSQKTCEPVYERPGTYDPTLPVIDIRKPSSLIDTRRLLPPARSKYECVDSHIGAVESDTYEPRTRWDGTPVVRDYFGFRVPRINAQGHYDYDGD